MSYIEKATLGALILLGLCTMAGAFMAYQGMLNINYVLLTLGMLQIVGGLREKQRKEKAVSNSVPALMPYLIVGCGLIIVAIIGLAK